MRSLILILIVFISFGCSKSKYEKKKIGGQIIEANFINDSLINGIAKIYDSEGKLLAQTSFINGIKNGPSVTFYENGKIKDSLNYSNDLLNETAFKYDSSGFLLFKRTNYYGIDMGDNSFYNNGKLEEYYFTNFERKQLVSCKYDSAGRCYKLMFNAKPLVSSVLLEKQTPAIQLFMYVPHPPSFEVIYKLGQVNSQNKKINETILNSNRLFIDTTLITSQKDLTYFISVDYRILSTDSTANILLEKLVPSSWREIFDSLNLPDVAVIPATVWVS